MASMGVHQRFDTLRLVLIPSVLPMKITVYVGFIVFTEVLVW